MKEQALLYLQDEGIVAKREACIWNDAVKKMLSH